MVGRLRGSQFALLGVLAAVLLAVGGSTCGAGRADSVCRPGASLLTMLGVLGLVAAWLGVGVRLRAAELSRRSLLLTLLGWAAPLAVSAPLFSRDLYSYLAQGELLVRGMDPYTLGPAALSPERHDLVVQVAHMWRHSPAPYGPLSLLLSGAASDLAGQNLWLAVVLARLPALLGVGLLAYFLPRLADRFGVRADLALWLGVLNPLVVLHAVGGGHNDALMVGLVVAGLSLACANRPLSAALLIAAAAAVKLPAIAALPFLVLLRPQTVPAGRHRVQVGLVVATAAVAVFGMLAAVTRLGFGWLRPVDTSAAPDSWLSPTNDVGHLMAALVRWWDLDGVDTGHLVLTVRSAGTLAGLCGLGVAWVYAARSRSDQHVVRALAAGLLAVVLLAPVVHPWYLLWGLPIVAATALPSTAVRILIGGSVVMSFSVWPNGATLSPDQLGVLAVLTCAAVAAVSVARLTGLPTVGAGVPATVSWRGTEAGPVHTGQASLSGRQRIDHDDDPPRVR